MPTSAPVHFTEPDEDCPLCPRLRAFRAENRQRLPLGRNAPAPSFGALDARLLIVGLAPGLMGANFTGRPFTGDFAGELLYATLLDFGFAAGRYGARADDGLQLRDARIANAVRCVPPQNKPTPEEIRQCRPFLEAEIAAMPQLRAILCLGRIAHDSVLRAFGQKLKAAPFAHGAIHHLGDRNIALFDSYHCSRYNTNTGVLTPPMFRAVFGAIRQKFAR